MAQTNVHAGQSFDQVRVAAERGEAAAQFYLGICYQTGQGVAQNYSEAVAWFRRASDQRDPSAQCYLGFCYQTGTGVPQDFVEAVRWFRAAARAGDKTDQHNLVVHYASVEAAEQAANSGEPVAPVPETIPTPQP